MLQEHKRSMVVTMCPRKGALLNLSGVLKMFSVIRLSSIGLIEIARLRTIEEAYDMLGKLMRQHPTNKYDILEVA